MSIGRDFDWHVNREAAMREQFPSLEKVERERPGSDTDREIQEFYRAENRIEKDRQNQAEHAAWLLASQAATIKREAELAKQKINREYKNHLKARALSGPFAYPKETAA